MTEQQKESSSANPKEKSSLLDADIGKEFLSSWKSMSMADDDAMDFSFDAAPKGNKNAFKFDKLDMDFNLDGEFDKISSFKVDMSDLDFSCSPKKPEKSKEKKGESSSAKKGGKGGFNFSFDFNELDSFNLDSSFTKADKSSNSTLNNKGITSDGSDCEGAKTSKLNDAESAPPSDASMAMKPLASERAEASKVQSLVGNPGNLSSGQDDSFLKFSSSENLEMSTVAIISSDSSKTLITEEMNQERELTVKTKHSELKSQQVTSEPLSQSVVWNDSKQDNMAEQHTYVCSPGTKVITGTAGRKNINENEESRVDSSPFHISKSERIIGEAVESGCSTQAEAMDNLQPAKIIKCSEDNTKTGVMKKILHDKDIRENQKSILSDSTPASSEDVLDKMMMVKGTEVQGMQSKFCSRPEGKGPLKLHPVSAETEVVSSGCKKVGHMHLRTINGARQSFRSNDTECGSKLVDSIPASDEPMKDESVLLIGKNDFTNSKAREGTVSDDMPSGGKLASNVKSIHQEVKKSKPILLETGMSTKYANMLSSQVDPSSLMERTAGHDSQMSVKPQADVSGKESFQKSKINSIVQNKYSVEAGKITPSSSFKALRNIGANKVPAVSVRQKETNTLGNSEQNVERRGITASKNDHLIGRTENQKPLTSLLKRNQKPLTSLLKRKSSEFSGVDLASSRSLKRSSRSPSKSRCYKDCSEKVVEQGIQIDNRPNNLPYNDSTSGLETSPATNLIEVGKPDSVHMEVNGNVEKAEAYNKELEEIINKLKKKNEEAKELFVRAIVNNNNLLMLNHPIYDDKIRKVQKFASQLMSKWIQT